MPKSVVAIVGRPNVGKSTLFNRLIKKRKAIVEDTPGVTRDRLCAEVDWGGREFILVDTGGIEPEYLSSSRQAGSRGYQLVEAVQKQIREAMEEANLLLLVLDAKEGLTPVDKEVANLLRRTKKPVILTVNKVDNKSLELRSSEFYNLGLGEPHLVSALHGLNTEEILDEVIAHLPEEDTRCQTTSLPPPIRVAIVGQPNVGKSSLLNAILGEERVVVDKAPGTTRDAIDTTFSKDNYHFILIDTAGIRKRKKVKSSLEYYSRNRALKAIERSDVVLMIIDAKVGVEKQDQKIAHFSDEGGKASVVVVNKWDLVNEMSEVRGQGSEDGRQKEEYIETIRKELHFIKYAPIIFVSAKTKQGVDKITSLVVKVREQHERRIATSLLNKVIESAKEKHQPKGGDLKIYYVTQPETKPPTFVFQVNNPKLMHFSYRRYLENKIRAAFDFKGTPIRMKIKGKKD